MAVTSFAPQLLASGSVDGDICIWNTSSELFVRRLDERKRRPNNSQAKVCRNRMIIFWLNAFSFALLISFKIMLLILL